jgi:hypothetical protein
MKKRFVIGYILLSIGIIMGAISVIFNLIYNIILKFDPEAFYAGVLIGTGLAWLLFIIPGSILVRKHEQKFVIGYILLNIGIIMGAISVIINLIQNIILKFDPEAFYAGVPIGTGLAWLLFIPGSILVRNHEHLFKTIIGAIITLLGVIAIYLSSDPGVIAIYLPPLVLFYLTPGIFLISNIKARFIIGYELLISGIIGAIISAFVYVNVVLNPPTGSDLGALIGVGLAIGFGWLFYASYSILIILGSIMVIKHRFFVKKLFALIVILLGIIPQIVVFVDLLAQRLREFERRRELHFARPIGPEPELHLFMPTDLELLLPPFVLYLIPGILLLKSSKQNRSE